jgi:hypothetical protein
MDAAYDAVQIWDQSRELGHVPIIDRNPRGKRGLPSYGAPFVYSWLY